MVFTQNPAQLFTLKPYASFYTKTLHSFLLQNPAQHFTPKPSTGFFSVDLMNTKTLRIFFSVYQKKTKTMRRLLYQNPAQLFATKPGQVFLVLMR